LQVRPMRSNQKIANIKINMIVTKEVKNYNMNIKECTEILPFSRRSKGVAYMENKKKSLWNYILEFFRTGKKPGKQKVGEEVKPSRFFLNTIQVYVNVLNMKNKNEELAAELKGLMEVITASEAVSCASIEGIEDRIKDAFGELQKLVEEGRTDGAKEACRRIKVMLDERNSVCRKVIE
jgi:hypothetical protein